MCNPRSSTSIPPLPPPLISTIHTTREFILSMMKVVETLISEGVTQDLDWMSVTNTSIDPPAPCTCYSLPDEDYVLAFHNTKKIKCGNQNKRTLQDDSSTKPPIPTTPFPNKSASGQCSRPPKIFESTTRLRCSSSTPAISKSDTHFLFSILRTLTFLAFPAL